MVFKNMKSQKIDCIMLRYYLKKNKRYLPLKRNFDDGFGIVESIASAMLLSVLIGLGLTLSTMLENTKYEASLRDAARQSIEDDVEKVKNFLFNLDYLAGSNSSSGQTQGACYKSHTSCTRGGKLNVTQVCRDYANRAINMIPGRNNYVLDLSSRNISMFGTRPFVIRRLLTIGTPNGSGTLTVDRSIIKGIYILENTTERKAGLSNNPNREVLRTEDFYPNGHPYCNPE